VKISRVAGFAAIGSGLIGAYVLSVRGSLTLDIGVGRRVRPLGPLHLQVSADPETVFDVIAAPYLGKTPRAMEGKLKVLERGSDMVLAAHYTPVAGGLTATTVETVQFQRPNIISFNLVRGPVPEVRETFQLDPADGGTLFTYSGEIGADLWGLGWWWTGIVAGPWQRTVEKSMGTIKDEAERIAGVQGIGASD
jgi:hypothetical protein